MGAEIIAVDFSIAANYEGDRASARGLIERDLIYPDWFENEMGVVIARAWEDFLSRNNMPGLTSLAGVAGDEVFPDQPSWVYANARTAFDYAKFVELVKADAVPRWEEVEGYEQSLRGLEQARCENLGE